MEEFETLNAALDEIVRLREQLKEAELQNLKMYIADAAGLPLSLSYRLRGNTEAELRRDAWHFAEAIHGRRAFRISEEDALDDRIREALKRVLSRETH